VILFTDIEGSTALTERLGDVAAMDFLRVHDEIIDHALREGQGNRVKHTGDGVMACFRSVVRAVEASIAIQQAFASQNQGNEVPLRVKIGMSAGEPVERDQDLFGAVVQLAARTCSQAGPGQILASSVIRDLSAGKGFRFVDRGEHVLKGFEEPRRLYEVAWS
jgi:class 3 adenylate cyclase